MTDGKPGDQNPGGDGAQGGKPQDPPPSDPGGEKGTKLEDATNAELITLVKDARKEAAGHRTKAQAAQDKVDELTKAQAELATKIRELEEAGKTVEQKEKERLEALEAKANRADALTPYLEEIKAEVQAAMKRINALKAAEKEPYTDLLNGIPEEDWLAKRRAIRAIDAAKGVAAKQADTVEPGDTGNPGEPGAGKPGQTPEALLGWSPSGMEEARLAGLVPEKK